MESLATAVAGRYTIGRELGAGGMATVYLARDLKHDRDVAIKVLRDDYAASVGAERFLAEIKTTAGLTHPHILPLHDSGEAEGYLYYVMPYVDGETLRERLDREHRLPIDEAVRIAREVADGLAYAHGHGVVHRDIKPENIFLHSGHALVADFGIARALSPDVSRLTSAGLAIGTPAYMSPEQALGEDSVNAHTDQYALASVLFEMLAGEAPFTGPTVEAILVQRFMQAPPRVSARRPDVGRTIDTAISTAMARDPEARFATIAAFAASLRVASAAPAQTDDRSIAVLPFANMSGDAANDYFSDGISEEIINALAQLDGLRVAARTSAFSYKGKNVDLRTIGEELGVATVLEGSVRKAGTRLRITAQLIDVANGYHRWSERYDREMTDVLAIQDEIACAIAAKLDVSFAGATGEKLVKPPTENIDAYDAYLKGRALMQQRGRALFGAVTAFERCIELDPEFSAADSLLGESLLLMTVWGIAPASAVSARAAAAIDRALASDPGSPLAHVALGVRCFWEFDREGAGAAWNRAFELDPGDADVCVFYSLYNLAYMRGQVEEALAILQSLVDADPRSAHLRAHLSVACSWARQFDRATMEARRGLELEPDQFYATWALLFALREHEPSEALELGLRAVDQHGRHAWLVMGSARAAQRAGRPDLALALRDELEARARSTFVQATPRALAAEAAGDETAFFSLVNLAITERDPMLALVMGHSPMFDRYRERPEFKAALHRMGWDEALPRLPMTFLAPVSS